MKVGNDLKCRYFDSLSELFRKRIYPEAIVASEYCGNIGITSSSRTRSILGLSPAIIDSSMNGGDNKKA